MDSTESGHKTASEILGLMSISVCDGVPGVMRISSGRAGPIVGVTVCSHGNEPSGLAAVDYLLNTLKLPVNLLRGEVYLVVNNLQAALESKRFVSVDMNRLPADTPTRDNDPASEVRRSRELLPIWKKFDVGLDIHSTSQDAPPMIISLGPMFHAELVRGFPIEIVISNIDRVQRGKPAPAFYGDSEKTKAIGIEAGQHDVEQAGKCASACAEALLQNLGMLPGTTVQAGRFREFRVVASIILPDESYSMEGVFENLKHVEKGTLIAKGSGPDFVMPIDGCTIMHNGKPHPDDPKNEALFITEPEKAW